MDGAIGPPFLNAEPLPVTAQPKSIVNGNYHTVVKAAAPRTSVGLAFGAADDRQADRQTVDDSAGRAGTGLMVHPISARRRSSRTVNPSPQRSPSPRPRAG